jgi:hypothetical protein
MLVAGNVESVRPLGDGDWRVLMTAPWTPAVPDGRPLRLVVLIDEQKELPRAVSLLPTVKLTFRDGHTRVARYRHQAK